MLPQNEQKLNNTFEKFVAFFTGIYYNEHIQLYFRTLHGVPAQKVKVKRMKYGFGIDVGGTSVKLGFFKEEGELLEKWEIPTRTKNGGELILPDIADAIEECLTRHNVAKDQVIGIGIGVPGPVADNGLVNRCVNLGWSVFNLHEALSALTGLPVKAGNDANVAALGEYWRGGGAGCSSIVMVTLGTGIGGGIIIGGQILGGAHGVGGEIGHIVLNKGETEQCGCGKFGCAEQYASATGIVRSARRYLAKSQLPSTLRNLENITCKDVFDHAVRGDQLAKEILEFVYDCLGEFLADVCCVCDPELVVIGGGVSKAGQVLLDGIARYFPHYMFHACKQTRFALAQLGNDAGMYGCFRLVLDHLTASYS